MSLSDQVQLVQVLESCTTMDSKANLETCLNYVRHLQLFVKIFEHVIHTCAWNYRHIFISNKKCLYLQKKSLRLLWCYFRCWWSLTLSWRRPLSYISNIIWSKSMDWFLYDIGLRHERVKYLGLMLAMTSCFMKHPRTDRRIINMRSCNLCACGSFCSKTKIIYLNNGSTSA